MRLHIEFDKNANSSYVSVLYTFRISLLSDKSGFAFFVRWLRLAHFFILEVVIVKKVVFVQEPSFLWDLYFVFYLRFNFKTLFTEPFPDEKTEEFATFCKNILLIFGDVPKDLAIFFKISEGSNSTFICDKYLKSFEKNFVGEYNVDFLQQELADYNQVIKRMLSFYLDGRGTAAAEECLSSKEKVFDCIKKSGLSMEEKINLYEFFMSPMQYITILQRTLMEKRALLSDYYREHYRKIINAYDQVAITELNNKMNIANDVVGLEGYVSYCLIDSFRFDWTINSNAYLYILGNKYEDALKKSDKTAQSDVADFCYAFGEKNRIDILRLLKEREEVTCKDLERCFHFSGSTAYHHISILHRTGIVKARNEGKTIFYSLNRGHMRQMLKCFDEFI